MGFTDLKRFTDACDEENHDSLESLQILMLKLIVMNITQLRVIMTKENEELTLALLMMTKNTK